MKNEKEVNKDIMREIQIAIMPFILIMVFETFFKIFNGGIYAIFSTYSKSLIFSIIIGYLIYGLLIGIFRKHSRAIKVFTIIGFVLLLINQIKIVYTGEPVAFSDINFIRKSGDLAAMISSNIIYMIKEYILEFIILLIILVIIVQISKRRDIEIVNKKIKILTVMICVIGLLILFIPSSFTKNIYLNYFFGINEYKDYESYTTNLSYYQKYTLLSGMFGTMLNDRFTEPQGYNEEELENIIKTSKEEIHQDLEKPNIILVFSESFWDTDKLEEIKFDKEVASNLKKLSQKGKNIELLTCSYGGMSENVAFELLTGGSLNYFSNGYIPIMSLYKRKNSENMPSIVKELKKNDYYSKVVFGMDYYESQDAFYKIGFDEYLQLEQTEENTKGGYISDQYLTDLIIKDFEDKKDGEKIFYMVETIQNHMPYTIDKYDNYDISIQENNFDEEINNTLLSYSQGIYDADKQLNRLYEYIQEYDEPTIIIFLGDHLPYLYTKKGENVLDKLNYFNTQDELENYYRKYNTQALILSNYETELEEIPDCVSDDLLLVYIINQMNIQISDYYKWLYTTINKLPASNKYISLDSMGNKYFTKNLDGEMLEMYKIKQKMQYKFFIN